MSERKEGYYWVTCGGPKEWQPTFYNGIHWVVQVGRRLVYFRDSEMGRYFINETRIPEPGESQASAWPESQSYSVGDEILLNGEKVIITQTTKH